MNADTDLIKLYSGRILELASDIPHIGRLDNPDGSAHKRSPVCGSNVTVDVKLDNDRVVEFAQDVKACALGQASASILGAVVTGLSRSEIQRGRDQLKELLTLEGPPPDSPFQELQTLVPAREFKNRHASILLAFEATLEAIDQAA